jgi:hypothetical protein
MDRESRQQNTDNTFTSLSSSLRGQIEFTNFAAEAMAVTDAAKGNLREWLSHGSIISTTSSFATRQMAAQAKPEDQTYMEIGRGGCGIIYEIPGTHMVAKKEIKQTTPSDSIDHALWNDFKMQVLIHEKFSDLKFSTVRVPRPVEYINGNVQDWWDEHQDQFPSSDRVRANIIISERILPLPQPVREALIDLYCPPAMHEISKLSQNNKSCLVFPCLGTKRRGRKYPNYALNLRNFALCVDQMEDIGLDVEGIASAMGETYAILHYHVWTDGFDVEFALGSAPTLLSTLVKYSEISELPPNSATRSQANGKFNFQKRKVQLWLLDFNQCHLLSKTDIDKDLELMKKAFHLCHNKIKFTPQPPVQGLSSNLDIQLWKVFCVAYRRRGKELLPATNHYIIERFVNEIGPYIQKHKGKRTQ